MRLAKGCVAVAWLSVVYVAVQTYLLFAHSGRPILTLAAFPVALLAVLAGAVGSFLAPPSLSSKASWASLAGSVLLVLPILLLGLLGVVIASALR